MTKLPITDEELVAYLDRMLDADRHREIEAALASDELLAARLGRLDIDTEAIRQAFAAATAKAPVAKLRSHLDRAPMRQRHQWLRIAATLLVGAGIGLGVGVSPLFATKSWRVAVADYHALYTTATLASAGGDRGNQRSDVATVANKLHLPISIDTLQLPGLDLRRAQLLQFEGQPLAQFAYLDQGGTPFAFCATQTEQADRAVETATLHGLAAAFWNKNGYGFIVIGGTDDEAVRRAADALAARI